MFGVGRWMPAVNWGSDALAEIAQRRRQQFGARPTELSSGDGAEWRCGAERPKLSVMSGTDPIPLLADLRALATRGLADALGIEIVELSRSRVVATMPVDQRTLQPFGILHGGASLALAETVASLGATANVEREEFLAMGLELNANHLRAKSDGVVTATATPIHLGRTTHVWDVRITDETGRLVCVSRCTLAIRPRG